MWALSAVVGANRTGAGGGGASAAQPARASASTITAECRISADPVKLLLGKRLIRRVLWPGISLRPGGRGRLWAGISPFIFRGRDRRSVGRGVATPQSDTAGQP